jgi:hypothetical protein
VSNNFDRARLETDDEEPNFPPTEPTSFRPTASFRPAANSAEHGFWASRPPSLSPAGPSLLPVLSLPPRRAPSPARSAFAKLLFATLFGGMALLLGYALLQRLS